MTQIVKRFLKKFYFLSISFTTPELNVCNFYLLMKLVYSIYCINYLLDINISFSSTIVINGGIQTLIDQTKNIEFIDVAENSIKVRIINIKIFIIGYRKNLKRKLKLPDRDWSFRFYIEIYWLLWYKFKGKFEKYLFL